MKVLITRPLFEEAIELVSAHAEIEIWEDENPITRDLLRLKASECDGILTTVMDKVDAGIISECKNLKVISQLGVGVDNIDVGEATNVGVMVGNTPGVVARPTADIAFGLLLNCARRISESYNWVKNKQWEIAFHPMSWLGTDVGGATLGIIGMGTIGREMLKRAQGFDMEVLYHSRTPKPDVDDLPGVTYCENMYELLSNSDYVSVHVPLTPETYYLISYDELKAMKKDSVLINTARGPIVNPSALYDALNEGWIRSAGIDVTDPEPIEPDSPLLTLDNLIISPHIGSASIDARRKMCIIAAGNLILGSNGERLEYCANPEVYQKLGL